MPWAGPGATPSRVTRKGMGGRAPGASTRWASRAWNRYRMAPPARSRTALSLPMVQSPLRAPLVRA